MPRPNFMIATFVPRFDNRDAYVGGYWHVIRTAETYGWAIHLLQKLEENLGEVVFSEYGISLLDADFRIPITPPPAHLIDQPIEFDDIPF